MIYETCPFHNLDLSFNTKNTGFDSLILENFEK